MQVSLSYSSGESDMDEAGTLFHLFRPEEAPFSLKAALNSSDRFLRPAMKRLKRTREVLMRRLMLRGQIHLQSYQCSRRSVPSLKQNLICLRLRGPVMARACKHTKQQGPASLGAFFFRACQSKHTSKSGLLGSAWNSAPATCFARHQDTRTRVQMRRYCMRMSILYCIRGLVLFGIHTWHVMLRAMGVTRKFKQWLPLKRTLSQREVQQGTMRVKASDHFSVNLEPMASVMYIEGETIQGLSLVGSRSKHRGWVGLGGLDLSAKVLHLKFARSLLPSHGRHCCLKEVVTQSSGNRLPC